MDEDASGFRTGPAAHMQDDDDDVEDADEGTDVISLHAASYSEQSGELMCPSACKWRHASPNAVLQVRMRLAAFWTDLGLHQLAGSQKIS